MLKSSFFPTEFSAAPSASLQCRFHDALCQTGLSSTVQAVLELITSKLLDVPHGFPTREGGVSTGVWASLNAGGSVGDDSAAVELNLQLLATAARVERDRLFGVKQVHG